MQKTNFVYEEIQKNKNKINDYADLIQKILGEDAHYFSYIDDVYQEEPIPKKLFSRIEILKNKHKHLEILFYNFQLGKMSIKMDEMVTQIKNFEMEHNKIENLEKRNQELISQFSSVTANLISLIITFTIVTTALSAMSSFKDFKLLSLFVVSLVFLGVSSIIVSSVILSAKTKINKIVVAIWIILFLIFIITLVITQI